MSDMKAVVFSVGPRIAALPVEHVEEVMRPLPLERLKSEQPFAAGVAFIRGRPVPVIDVESLFGDVPAENINRFITVRVGSRAVALAVSNVLGVWDEHSLDLQEVPPLLEGAAAGAIEAVGRLDEQLLTLLHTGKLVPEELWNELEAPVPVS